MDQLFIKDIDLNRYNKVFLLDYSWHMYRNYYVFKNLSIDIQGYHRPTGHIYGILKTLRTINDNYPNSLIILCKDGIPVRRNQLMAESGLEYKADRPELEFNFFQDLNYITALAMLIPNVYLAYNEDQESDDIMYALAKQIERLSTISNIYIYSGDNDLLQGISDRISVVRSHSSSNLQLINNETLQTDDNLIKKFQGLTSDKLPLYRAIVGDSSDAIKGLYRYPRKDAKQVALTVRLPEEIKPNIFKINISEKSRQRLLEGLEVVSRNYQLMKLSENIEVNLMKGTVKNEIRDELISKFKLFSFDAYIKNL